MAFLKRSLLLFLASYSCQNTIAASLPTSSTTTATATTTATISHSNSSNSSVQSNECGSACEPAQCSGLPPMALNGSNIEEVLGACFGNPDNNIQAINNLNTNESSVNFFGPLRHQEACHVNYTYLRFGNTSSTESPPLLLITGTSMTMASWTTQFLWQLAQTREVIVFDNQGIGMSVDNTNQTLTVQNMAANTLCLLEELNIDEVDVFGFSMGGQIALSMVAIANNLLNYENKYNNRTIGHVSIRQVISSAGNAGGNETVPPSVTFQNMLASSQSPQESEMAYMLMFFPSALPASTRSCLVCQFSIGISRFPYEDSNITSEIVAAQTKAEIAWLQDKSVWNAIANASTPLLLITGTDDEICPSVNQRILANQYAQGNGDIVQVVEWPSAGHGVQFSYGNSVENQINNFLLKKNRIETY